MKRYAPLLTLLVGLVVAGVLVTASTIAAKPTAAPQPAAAEPAGAEPAPAGSATPASSPTPPPPPAPPPAKVNATWAGQVDGGGAAIAIAVKDGVAIAYLCDGRRIEAWLQGTAAAGVLSLTGKGGASLTGTFGNGKATGTVRVSGRTWKFTAPAVKPPSGLYRATAQVRNAQVVGGWIVYGNGRQTGVLLVDDEPEPAPALDVASGVAVVDGTPITAAPVN